ncbi:MAG: N-acetyltransferase [Alphaproteobacteria bacterium]|nr:MAG: N-acetyltransferase [Alphaproteobacteria bacterium]
MSLISLRPAVLEDASFVDRLTRLVMQSYVELTWTETSDIEAYFYKNRFNLATTKIIQLDGKDIGRVSVLINENKISIDNIHILPEYQNKGIGSGIIQKVIDEADIRNLPVVLHVLKVNPAKKLYYALGFNIEEDEIHRYYLKRPSQNEAALESAA